MQSLVNLINFSVIMALVKPMCTGKQISAQAKIKIVFDRVPYLACLHSHSHKNHSLFLGSRTYPNAHIICRSQDSHKDVKLRLLESKGTIQYST